MKFAHIYILLAALLATACSSNITELPPAPDSDPEDDGMVDVTFSVSTECFITSRSAGPGSNQRISKGANVNMLIYAVYDEDFALLRQYSNGYELAPGVTENFSRDEPAFRDEGIHYGQTVVKVDDILAKGENYTFTIRLMRNKVYHLALWAQSSKTDAFNTNDLENVIINYTHDFNKGIASENVTKDFNDAVNNDEFRDAFCKTESFSVSPVPATRQIILTRPFAQLNVGTTIPDYLNLVENVYNGREITKSKVTVSGVANRIDVARDIIYSDNPSASVTFDFGGIVANSLDPEEYLYVDLDGDGKIVDLENHVTKFPTLDPAGGFLTETFKYLSMCYVLVPANRSQIPPVSNGDDADYGSNDIYDNSVLQNVTVYFANDDNDNLTEHGITLSNVPVHRNWRTNILGGLTSSDKPSNSIFNIQSVKVGVETPYYGDNNTTK